MGYHRMKTEDLYSIYKRWKDDQKTAKISRLEGFDRKTIRFYINQFNESNISEYDSYGKEALLVKLSQLLPVSSKIKPVTSQIDEFKDEIARLMSDEKEVIKLTTLFRILRDKYGYSGSYETLKIYVKSNNIKKPQTKQIIRIESPPGDEIQLDYGKVGTLFDPFTGRNRTVHAFCGILSFSRLPYIEFVFSMDQKSFSESTINMFEYFDGSPKYISPDNLKTGVIKPDLYDPKLNRAYMELSDYYQVFINPCRVATPTDKGKIERFIQVARQMFLELKNIYPDHNIHELNQKVKVRCKEVYGNNIHGTTRLKPLDLYNQHEKDRLSPLPHDRFEVCEWKQAKVHPDQFIQVEKKRYSLPAKYRQMSVDVKMKANMIYIYSGFELVRSYIIPKGASAVTSEDFPEVTREIASGTYPEYILNQSKFFGDKAHALIEKTLKPHAFLNCRRALGMIDVFKTYSSAPKFSEVVEIAINKSIVTPKGLEALFDEYEIQNEPDITISENGKKMSRDIGYFFN